MTHIETVQLGYGVPGGAAVSIPIRNMVVTGQTQEAGKTTALEGLLARSDARAVTFITKRGESAFAGANVIEPYFRERVDWRFVAAILEASEGQKLKFERPWIMRVCKLATTLGQVHQNVKTALEKAKGLSADVYTVLDHYLDAIVPQIHKTRWAHTVHLSTDGLVAMDLVNLSTEMQQLVIRSTVDWILENAKHTIVVIPEAWKFVPEGRNTPVKLSLEAYIRQGSGIGDYVWLDSQDIAGVDKKILKSVPVWVLGVQREANEIKRTLDNIPAGVGKPSPADVATLELGQFIACWGKNAVRTYAQPTWLDNGTAQMIAMGRAAVELLGVKRPRSGVQERLAAERAVGMARRAALEAESPASRDYERLFARVEELEKDNQALRADFTRVDGANRVLVEDQAKLEAEIARLRRENAVLREQENLPLPEPRSELIEGDGLRATQRDMQDGGHAWTISEVVESLAERILAGGLSNLRIVTAKPELTVEVVRHTIEASGNSLRGRIAGLLSEGFFEEGATVPMVAKELARRGYSPDESNTRRELGTLAEMGFVTIEEGKDERSRKRTEYKAVADMKVHVIQRNA